MILKLSMKHQGIKLYKVCINHDPGMTLTYFMTRLTKLAYAFEWGKIWKILNGRKLAGNEQMDRRFMFMKGVCLPIYWYISQILGECLQAIGHLVCI